MRGCRLIGHVSWAINDALCNDFCPEEFRGLILTACRVSWNRSNSRLANAEKLRSVGKGNCNLFQRTVADERRIGRPDPAGQVRRAQHGITSVRHGLETEGEIRP